MSRALINIIAEAELPDGTLAVVEDVLTENVFHVYKKTKNVQPNHDAKGVMRYLMVVLHALGYRADKAETALKQEQANNKKLEAKNKLLSQLVNSFERTIPYNNIVSHVGSWKVAYTADGANVFRHDSDPENQWRPAKNVDEIFEYIYTKENP